MYGNFEQRHRQYLRGRDDGKAELAAHPNSRGAYGGLFTWSALLSTGAAEKLGAESPAYRQGFLEALPPLDI